MAYKSFRSLTPRNQSSLVTQLHKLINYYGEIFCPRERTYIKSLTQNDGSVYWLEDEEKKMVAVAIIDPNYTFEVNGVELLTLSYTISKRPGQMDRILSHIWSDYDEKSIILLCKKTLASVFDLEELQLVELSPLDLQKHWPDLANLSTNFFNVTRETFAEGLSRKDYYVYLKLTLADQEILKNTAPELYKLVQSKKVVTVS